MLVRFTGCHSQYHSCQDEKTHWGKCVLMRGEKSFKSIFKMNRGLGCIAEEKLHCREVDYILDMLYLSHFICFILTVARTRINKDLPFLSSLHAGVKLWIFGFIRVCFEQPFIMLSVNVEKIGYSILEPNYACFIFCLRGSKLRVSVLTQISVQKYCLGHVYRKLHPR